MSSNSVARMTKAHTLPDKIRYATLLACKSKSCQPVTAPYPSHYRENLPQSAPGVDYCHCLRSGLCRIQPNPLIEPLLIEANKLIRDHEDTRRALKRPAWNNVTACWYSAANTSLTNKGYPPRKAPPCSICLNTGAHAFREISPVD